MELRTRCGLRTKVWKVSGPGTEKRPMLGRSEGRQAKEDAILNSARKRFEAAPRVPNLRLGRKGCLRNYDKMAQRVGRIKEGPRRVDAQHRIEVRQAPESNKPAR